MPEEELVQKLRNFFEKLSVLEEDPNYKIYYKCGLVPMQRAMLSGNRVADFAKMAQALATNQKKTEIIIYTDEMHDNTEHMLSVLEELRKRGFVCLAEGAESKNQVDRLRELGCEIIQGYYYSKPIPISEYEEKYL